MAFSNDRFNFRSGLNDTPNPSLVDKDQASRSINMNLSEPGSIFKRLGSKEVGADADGDPIHSMFGFYEKDLTRHFMVGFGVDLETLDLGTALMTNVETGLTNAKLNFQTFTNLLYYLNGSEFHSWDGAATVVDLPIVDVNAPLGRYLIAFRNTLFVLGVTNDRSTLFFSDSNNGTNWTTGAAGSLKVGGDDGDFGTALGIVNDRLICFKSNSVYEVNFDTGLSAFTISPIHLGIGTPADGSVTNVPLGADDGLIFLGNDDSIYMLGQLPNFPLSNKPIRISTLDGSKGDVTETLKSINRSQMDIVRSFYSNFEYHLWIPTGKNIVTDTVLIFDVRNKTWTTNNNISAGAALMFRQSDNISIKPYYGSTSETKVFELFADNTYGDQDINAYSGLWETGWLDQEQPDRSKNYRDIFVEGFLTPSTILDIEVQYDFEDSKVIKQIDGSILFAALGTTLSGSIGIGTIGTITIGGKAVTTTPTGWGSGQTIFHFDAKVSLEPRFAQQIKITFRNDKLNQTFKLLNSSIEFKLRGRGNYPNAKKL